MAVSAVIGAIVGTGAGYLVDMPFGLLVAVFATHLVFVAGGWMVLWPLDAAATKTIASNVNYRRGLDEIMVLVVSVGVLFSNTLLVVLNASKAHKWAVLVAICGVFLAWGSLQLMYVVRYAYEYYAVCKGSGIEFSGTPDPAYRDFFYFSYNLGMTYSVSDTTVTNSAIRSVVLRQGLLSFVFGAVILASTLNLVSGALS